MSGTVSTSNGSAIARSRHPLAEGLVRAARRPKARHEIAPRARAQLRQIDGVLMANERWLDRRRCRVAPADCRAAIADSYHDAPYHQLSQARGDGEPRLFVWVGRRGMAGAAAADQAGRRMRRTLRCRVGLRLCRPHRLDGSAFGRAGCRLPPCTRRAARRRGCRQPGRPLAPADRAGSAGSTGLGTVRPLGETVSIDLTLDDGRPARRLSEQPPARSQAAGTRRLHAPSATPRRQRSPRSSRSITRTCGGSVRSPTTSSTPATSRA